MNFPSLIAIRLTLNFANLRIGSGKKLEKPSFLFFKSPSLERIVLRSVLLSLPRKPSSFLPQE